MSTVVELPSAQFDALIEDAVPAVVGDTPTLINQDPEPGEALVPKSTSVTLDVATLAASGTVDLSTVSVYIAGALAFQAGAFQAGFAGSYTNPVPDVLRVLVDRAVDFDSEQVVSVRVVARAVGGASSLDTTYSFTVADTTAPRVVSAEARDLNVVRVTFSESVVQDGAVDLASALRPASWAIDRLGDYLQPLVSAYVVSVASVEAALNQVDLTTDIPLTPGGTYQVRCASVEDIAGNAIAPPYDSALFVGWAPPRPEGRVFDLYQKLADINRAEDETLDLKRFIACLQEVTDILLYDVDRWVDIIDPDLAPEDFVDAMLADLGNPFAFELTLADKRRLVQVLVPIYQLKGTEPGIKDVIRFFLKLEVSVDPYNSSLTTWILGDGELGVDSNLGTTVSSLLYSFRVTVSQVLTASQRAQLRSIVEYMKPAHTHFVALVEPTVPVVLDHLELGLSELGEEWLLH